jgi:hypothetical protein
VGRVIGNNEATLRVLDPKLVGHAINEF